MLDKGACGFGESAAFFLPTLSLPLVGQDEDVDEGGKNALTPAPRRRRPSPVGRGELLDMGACGFGESAPFFLPALPLPLVVRMIARIRVVRMLSPQRPEAQPLSRGERGLRCVQISSYPNIASIALDVFAIRTIG